mmetsp:Transcript_67705/g.82985  ORF Transcript_67705/g.82985 Transcript_67705/m.82985 type:complete len:130 (+) Transcript_67705:60-449(+)
MNFCDECNNLMFPYENRQKKKLMFKCKHCSNKISVNKSLKEYCVYTNYVNEDEETNLEAIINPDVTLDPTLPRSNELACAKCSYKSAVFFNAKSKNPDEAMTLILVCIHCRHFWKKKAINDDNDIKMND